ncbi:HAMP domain-containing histidine kinase [Hymenobacter sp. BT186]|uniref:histidine kinase n=2 Tax=Hymenobacter telluris TaxID=2816474 RepID=A0A939EZH3_9BACT|nr:HAMP domain-containing histidine kinase [Hymenobacter telluris]MBW3376029.1 HAMP domain-containing histidine kinase [Hymenobacter norwichensis]
MLAAIPYSLVYAWLGFPLAPRATFIYIGFSLANLLLLFLTKKYSLFTTAQLVAIILNPIMAHVAIGGFVDSSAIILSAILSPLGALMFTNYRTARIYFVLFVLDVVVAGVWDYLYVSGEPKLPKGVLIVSFVSNLVIICLIIYLLIANVLQKREEAQQELQQSLDHLRATQVQLVQREKMASLGELTAGIAHEIQNPLNFVNNFSEVSTELVEELSEENHKPERDAGLEDELLHDLQQNLRKITHHGRRASSIVRDMLEHSRASTGERQPTDLAALCDEYLRLAYHGLRAKDKSFNATLETRFPPDLRPVNLIGQDIARVMLNLFTNAFYAVRERQQRGEAGYLPTVAVSIEQDAEQVRIRVRDNGTGIPESVKHKIFQPFFTTKPTGEGTGLGLSLSYDIITKGCGGTLTAETTEGQGTELTVTLPTCLE